MEDDLLMNLKKMESEINFNHLEKVNIVIGRFVPFTEGHLSMAKELFKTNGLPTVYVYIRSKSGKNSVFSDNLVISYMEGISRGQKLVRDVFPMPSAFIPDVIKQAQIHGYNPMLLGAGNDRASSYENMLKRSKDINIHPDFKVHEFKERFDGISATKVRDAILNNDKKTFLKYTPKEIHPYYSKLKTELQNSIDNGTLKENTDIVSLFKFYDISLTAASKLLEKWGQDFCSDSLIIESLMTHEFANNNKQSETEESTVLQSKKVSTKNNLDILKTASALVLENVISLQKNRTEFYEITNKMSHFEKKCFTYLINIDESKLNNFKNKINEIFSKDKNLIDLLDTKNPLDIKTFKEHVTHCDFNKLIKTTLMKKNYNDYQIDDFVDTLTQVEYQYYINTFNG